VLYHDKTKHLAEDKLTEYLSENAHVEFATSRLDRQNVYVDVEEGKFANFVADIRNMCAACEISNFNILEFAGERMLTFNLEAMGL
jgi:hypothetical protein